MVRVNGLCPGFLQRLFPHCIWGHISVLMKKLLQKFSAHIKLYGFLRPFLFRGLNLLLSGGGYNEIYYSTMLFTAILFLSLKTSGFGQVSAISYVPVRCSLDIYVWHRLAYFLFCLVGLRLEGWASVVFFVSFAIRKSMEWQKCLTGC